MKPWRWFRVFAVVAKPLLRLIGVKGGTVADKVAEAAPVIVDAVESEKKRGEEKPP